ncbi:MAG TPA: hypothetical protein VNN62_27920 [Methylomirabilota bacterium]|nr:hypothetical protein [Methylomirabilota bacterium]
MLRRLVWRSFLAAVFLLGSWMPVCAQSSPFGLGSFGGEWRGMTRVTGKIVCAPCTLKEARQAMPDQQQDLYEFLKGDQSAVFQVTAIGDFFGVQDASQAAYWQTVTGLNKTLSARTSDNTWRTLTAEKNLNRPVLLNCFLRSTNTLDIAAMTYLE